jgi:HEPN domain-containing protein
MNPMSERWVKKAENDLKIGKDELHTEEPATDMVCFHMQQCVEKYLKAYLTLKGQMFRKTHDIAELIELCQILDKDFEQLYHINAHKLTRYAVEIRYPEDFFFPDIEEANKCLEIAESVRDFVKDNLGL